MRAQSLILLGLSGVSAYSGGSASVYGISSDGALISVDATTGITTRLSAAMPNEINPMELAATDASRGRFYTGGINHTDGSCNLLVWDLKSSTLKQTVKLPFEQVGQPGQGQTLDVDPETGTLIVTGHDPSKEDSHVLYTADPSTLTFKMIADISDWHKGDVQRVSAFDSDQKLLYKIMVRSGGEINFVTISLTGTVTMLSPIDGTFYDLVYDPSSKRMYGSTTTGRMSKGTLVRSLSYFETVNPGPPVTVAPLVGGGVQFGNIHAFDSTAGILYMLTAAAPKVTGYVPSGYCAAHNETCAAGSKCCSDPADPRSPSEYGACYGVTDCADVNDGFTLPHIGHLLGTKVSTGEQVSHAPICDITVGPAKNSTLPPCPWAIGVVA